MSSAGLCAFAAHSADNHVFLASPRIEVHETQNSPNLQDSNDDEISLLDLLATVTENLTLLVIGPLLAGLVALGVTFVVPPTYESRSVLRLEESTIALIKSDDLLTPLLPKAPWIKKDAPLSGRLQRLRDEVESTYNKKDKTLTISVSGPSPQESQQLHNAVINELRKQMRPKGLSLEQIETRRATTQSTLDELSQVIASLAQNITRMNGDSEASSRAYSLLVTQRLNSQQTLQDIEFSLKPFGDEAFVQTPSLPDKPTKPKKGLIAVITTLGAGVGLLVFVLLRQALRNAKRHNPQDAERLATIKKNTAKSVGLGDRQL